VQKVLRLEDCTVKIWIDKEYMDGRPTVEFNRRHSQIEVENLSPRSVHDDMGIRSFGEGVETHRDDLEQGMIDVCGDFEVDLDVEKPDNALLALLSNRAVEGELETVQ